MKNKATKKKATRKTLPKDLDELLDAAAESGDYGAVYEALQRCLPDARGGYGNRSIRAGIVEVRPASAASRCRGCVQ